MKKEKIKLLTYKMYISILVLLSLFPNRIKSSNEIISENNLQIIDKRYYEDANIQICNSYKVNSPLEMISVINILDTYKNKDWDRSDYSLFKEWIIHNICYSLGYKKENTADVDFRNSEEKTYSIIRVLN